MFYQIAIYLAVIILYVSGDSETERNLNPQIMGGVDVDIKEVPYIVSIRNKHGRHFCGGTIYSRRIIITAAHCVIKKDIEDLMVVAGSSTSVETKVNRKVEKLFTHPSYNRQLFDYDVAILLLDFAYIFNFFIKPIDLATVRPADGETVVVSGWGFKIPETDNSIQLQQVRVKIINQYECGIEYEGLISPRMLCAGRDEGGKDACTNDSGGPLVYLNQLLGIVSFGYLCGDKNYPGVYTSVPDVLDWINFVIKEIQSQST